MLIGRGAALSSLFQLLPVLVKIDIGEAETSNELGCSFLLAMGAGMLPIALGFGADPSFRAPMAIVVIGGLITSTFLSLLAIPVLYALVDEFVQWCKPQNTTRRVLSVRTHSGSSGYGDHRDWHYPRR